MVKFEGKWKYQSYRPHPGSLGAIPKPATDDFPIPPNFFRWSPPCEVIINPGELTGTLKFPEIQLELDLTNKITDGVAPQVSISAIKNWGGGKVFTNELFGWFVPSTLGQDVGIGNPLVVRGCIVQTSVDIPAVKQPPLTTGFFILEPL